MIGNKRYNSKMGDRQQNTIASIQMCSYLMNLTSDIEAIGTKLDIPHYKVRERDELIKKRLNEIYQIVMDEAQETCDEATRRLTEITDDK